MNISLDNDHNQDLENAGIELYGDISTGTSDGARRQEVMCGHSWDSVQSWDQNRAKIRFG
ncbi:2565_t:CDS:2 [Ambispora gerdemannii]|uniref:2565_t:CDS:1 n=1 Tax=Ambispora gerdemannii TaxID=144530 RepID=A0A9N9EYH2_9GLOM|nr:2565_t:CDS:2 [Ambispora gerdemannii]